jgi:hypothetical protein
MVPGKLAEAVTPSGDPKQKGGKSVVLFLVVIFPGRFPRLIHVRDQISGVFDAGWVTSERASQFSGRAFLRLVVKLKGPDKQDFR